MDGDVVAPRLSHDHVGHVDVATLELARRRVDQPVLLTLSVKRLRVEDEESVYLFLMQFMECQKETAGSLRQRYEQQYRCEHPVHRLELTPELFLVLDGQTLADFGGDNWRQKLEEMELVL